MSAEWTRQAWWILAGLGALFFADTPFRTFRQRFLVRRMRERLILLSLELDLAALWAIAAFFLHWHWPLSPAGMAPFLALPGLALGAAGVALAVWAKLRLGRWFSATFGVKEGHELVTDGPYALTRHPIYTGILASLAGAALVWNEGLTLALTLGLTLPFFFHTAYEESMFEKHFGAAYFEYQRRVPRLVPFTRPGPPREA